MTALDALLTAAVEGDSAAVDALADAMVEAVAEQGPARVGTVRASCRTSNRSYYSVVAVLSFEPGVLWVTVDYDSDEGRSAKLPLSAAAVADLLRLELPITRADGSQSRS